MSDTFEWNMNLPLHKSRYCASGDLFNANKKLDGLSASFDRR